MNLKLLRKSLAIGFIVLFLIYMPIITANTISYSNNSIESKNNVSIDDQKNVKIYFLFIERLRGKIKDLEVLDEHNYRFTAIHVVGSILRAEFFGFFPFDYSYEKVILENKVMVLNFEENVKFIKERVTENYIDIIIMSWQKVYL